MTRKIINVIFILLFITICSPETVKADGNGDIHVWVLSGEDVYAYHNAKHYSDRYRIEMTLEEAIKDGYEKCQVCTAPLYTGTAKPEKERKKHSGGGSNGPNKTTPPKTYESPNETSVKSSTTNMNTKEEIAEEPSNDTSYVPYAIGGAVILGYLGYSSHRQKKKEEEEKAKRAEEWQKKYDEYYNLYAYRDPLDLVGKPEKAFIKEGLPATHGSGKYGKYTVYVTKKGSCFHLDPNCIKNTKIIVSNYCQQYNKRMCQKCVKGNVPEIQWYKEYKKITNIKNTYNIHDNE